MLVFIRVYVCVKAKLTFVSYFFLSFFCTFPLEGYLVQVGLKRCKKLAKVYLCFSFNKLVK